jgi:predicted phage terminase large subunit-like protein
MQSTGLSESLRLKSPAELISMHERLTRLRELQASKVVADRAEFLTRYPTPGIFAQAMVPRTRQTPALEAIDNALVDWTHAPQDRGRLMVFMAPQEGKSTKISAWTPLWRLAADPTLRIAIVSYASNKAERWGRWIKRMIEGHPELGITLMPDSRAVDRFETTAGGQVICVGMEGGITGEPVDDLYIDDPLRGRAEAESPTYRERAWEWWESNGATRLSARGRVVLMLCMTGDTPVLLPDGTEKPLRDVRPGDEVATYDGAGRLATSTVMNWANQGPDDLLRIRMTSGRVVRANARHPFLTIDANGRESWLRTDQIRPGAHILTATGESGVGSPARPTNAICPHAAKECATPTTARPERRPESARLRRTLRGGASDASSTVTGSPMKRLTSSSKSRAGTALSAEIHRPTATPAPTGTGSCASTTTTTPGKCAACSATTATSPSDTGGHPQSSGLPLTTWSVTPDEVVSVEPCGREDVFDLQIDRTENFIANGLVSHNTRWHADDLAGRLQKEEPGEWTVLRVPAIRHAELPIVRGNDGASVYSPGGELISVQNRRPGYFKELKAKRSGYVWRSVYDQDPVAAEGNLFHRADFRYWHPLARNRDRHDRLGGARIRLPDKGASVYLSDCWRFLTVDLAGSVKTSADFTVASVWALTGDGELVLLDRIRQRLEEGNHWQAIQPLAARWQADDVFVERGFIGTTMVVDATKAGLRVQPVDPDRDKITRAIPATHRVAAHTVWFPTDADGHCVWLDEWCDELAGFPSWAHDDQVDTLTYAVRVSAAKWNPMTSVALPREAPRPDPIADAYASNTGTYEPLQGFDPLAGQW